MFSVLFSLFHFSKPVTCELGYKELATGQTTAAFVALVQPAQLGGVTAGKLRQVLLVVTVHLKKM